jgi:hypothetical protein
MKVALAAQTVSSSVAKAMQFLLDGNVKDFEDASATIEFIHVRLLQKAKFSIYQTLFLQMIDELFDVLNSRSPIAKGAKGPITRDNWDKTRHFLLRAKAYLLSLKRTDGTPLYSTRRYFTTTKRHS